MPARDAPRWQLKKAAKGVLPPHKAATFAALLAGTEKRRNLSSPTSTSDRLRSFHSSRTELSLGRR